MGKKKQIKRSPVGKIMRRLGFGLEGLKRRDCDVEKKFRQKPPGQHGTVKKPTEYALQLIAKQTIKAAYVVAEGPFKRYYQEAARKSGITGEELLKSLEMRLDTIVYRMGFGATIREARQLVSHKAVLVNDNRVNIGSYQVKVGDIVSIRDKSKEQVRIKDSLILAQEAGFADWLDVDSKNMSGVVKRVPDRTEISADFNEQLVVELYSK